MGIGLLLEASYAALKRAACDAVLPGKRVDRNARTVTRPDLPHGVAPEILQRQIPGRGSLGAGLVDDFPYCGS